ncbi:membrane integrity-associated transporter subunit PqiC [Marinomonas sp. A79]|uniref:Membrane integrity-associated transporter subunit PqiC n=1 Tax=Marinomonas vulgaris TaxID=2823372 RepID=A0ABS5HDE2_9GAMM|nr:ABC-type transport auxiliary lipoprotein family protein [Marinomonas vulgaris]MBR7888969.1 membrane integrity-associated transporter subunit PqiC [Marinomonas vulgaris]
MIINKRLLSIGVLSGWLLGCAAPVAPPSKEYLLLDAKLEQVSALPTSAQSVQLMPVVVANYLAGNDIVLVSKEGVVHRSQQNLWAESLSAQLTRLTQQRLENTLPQLSWFSGQRLPAYAIAELSIEVDKFYADLEGQVHLSGRWQLMSAEGEVWRTQAFYVQSSLNADGYTVLVQTLSLSWFDEVVNPMANQISQVFKSP